MNLSPRLRRRRRPEPSPNENTKLPDQKEVKQESNTNKATSTLLYYTLGVGCMVLTGFVYSKYIKLLHENNLWFSRLQAVDREISFRTESGFYYSFFKELSTGPNMYDKVVSLLADNRTESWRSINALRRFNIYQEVFLAILYRLFAFDQVRFSRALACCYKISTDFMLGTYLKNSLAMKGSIFTLTVSSVYMGFIWRAYLQSRF